MNRPSIKADIVFLAEEEGGRQLPPDLGQPGRYRPHIVLQDRGVRAAVVGRNNTLKEEYLGVAFLEAPTSVRPGESIRCTLELCYFPNVSYSRLVVGATFTIREGATVVGHGVVIERTNEQLDPLGRV